MKNFNPRHLRKRYAKNGGASGDEKSRAFRRCKKISDQFIHQSASSLEKASMSDHYSAYCAKTADGKGFRR